MRDLDSVIAEASALPVVRVIAMVRLDFDSGVVAWHSGFGNITFGGATYNGVGTLGSVSSVREQPGTKSSSMKIQISGVNSAIVSLALSEPYINRPASAHITILDDQDRPLTATPLLIFKGTMDNIEGLASNTPSFQVTIKSRLADWERKRNLRYTDADQRKLHPGDRGMEYIPQMSQRKLIWPKAAFLPAGR